jgi:hypothetical protein
MVLAGGPRPTANVRNYVSAQSARVPNVKQRISARRCPRVNLPSRSVFCRARAVPVQWSRPPSPGVRSTLSARGPELHSVCVGGRVFQPTRVAVRCVCANVPHTHIY